MGNNKVFTPPCDWDNGTYAVDGVLCKSVSNFFKYFIILYVFSI